jgi:hypothetical protein
LRAKLDVRAEMGRLVLAAPTPQSQPFENTPSTHIRIRFGRDNRIGHNWEAGVEWFIDKFTEGAEFVKQNHRRNTLILLRE